MTTNYDATCYRKNYLVDVVAKIDFVSPAKALSSPVLPELVQQAIKERYQIYEPTTGLVQGIEISESGVSPQKREEFHQWVYHGSEREKTLMLSKRFLHVSLKKYKNYEGFKLDVIEPIKKLAAAEGEMYISRTGLRFINIFDGLVNSYNEIPTYFSHMISSQFNNMMEAGNCSRSFLVSEYLYDEIKLRQQTGIYNPDYPATIKKKDFVVDIDAYIDTPHAFSDVAKLLDGLHEKIQFHFESCITSDMRKILNERK